MGMSAAVVSGRWDVPTLDQQVERAEWSHADELLYCKDAWALRHYWINRATGERQRARCNRWECLHCGPRKVDLWRRLVKEAEPVLFLTLTKAGKTVEQARRALTTFIQALRRGSKGRGPNHIGARLAYLIEYFGVLERHSDFERNGFHWHLLIKGVDRIPYKEVIVPLWTSAIRGKRTEAEMLKLEYGYSEEEIQEILQAGDGKRRFQRYGWIDRIRNSRAIGYVTKYLTKSLSVGERGTKEVGRERLVLSSDENGNKRATIEMVKVEVTSKAHRVCYSRQFFPEKVSDLRKRLFAGLEGAQEEDNGLPLEEGEGQEPEKRSDWALVEYRTEEEQVIEAYKQERYQEVTEELSRVRGVVDEKEYERCKVVALAEMKGVLAGMWSEELRRKRRDRLREVLEEQQAEGKRISRRVIHVWHYQRRELRAAGRLIG